MAHTHSGPILPDGEDGCQSQVVPVFDGFGPVGPTDKFPFADASILNHYDKEGAILGAENVGIAYTFPLPKTADSLPFPHRSPSVVPPNTHRALPQSILEVFGRPRTLGLRGNVIKLSMAKKRQGARMEGAVQAQ